MMALQVPATLPLPSSLSGQAAPRSDDVSLVFIIFMIYNKLCVYLVRNKFSAPSLKQSYTVLTPASLCPNPETRRRATSR
jgi:hypothetical protein